MISLVPPAVAQAIEAHTGTIREFARAGGGCINQGGRVTATRGVFFLKWNDLAELPGMFSAEANGLRLLKRACGLRAAEVVIEGEADGLQFLLLEYIAPGTKRKDYWRDFGTGLASLHKDTAKSYGLDHDNYIGSLPQKNKPSSSWVEFFTEQRLKVQLRIGMDQKKIDLAMAKRFETLFSRVPALLPEERPSLLHGDLWSGNLMVTPDGSPCLIDPAVYYGHREADLAMTQLFGGFDSAFIAAYRENYPLLSGYHERVALYNLYPLMVHLNLFGGEYRAQVEAVLRKFS